MEEMVSKKRIYIMDGYAFIYRSYYAFINRPLTNSKGTNISAVFGFFKTLHSILKKEKPKYFVVALDSRSLTFRHKLYEKYKANRKETPKDLHSQIPIIQDALKTMNIPFLQMEGYEADDVISSITKGAVNLDFEVRIISGDKDLMQLINDNVKMIKQDAKGDWQEYGEEQVKEEWGVAPSLMLSLLSLTGDVADNVPGVKGIGGKTAAKLLNEYESLENIYQNIDKIKGSQKAKLLEGKENAFFSRYLIQLNSALDVGIIESYNIENVDLTCGAEAFSSLELPSVAKLYKEFGKNKTFSDDANKNLDEKDALDDENVLTERGLLGNDEESDVNQCENEPLSNDAFAYNAIKIFPAHIDLASDEDQSSFLKDFFSTDSLYVFYNTKDIFIKMLCFYKDIPFPNNFFDLKIAAYLLDSREKDYSINSIAKKYMPSLFEDKKGVNLEVSISRPGTEHILLELYSILEKKLRSLNLLPLFYKIEMPLIPILAKMENKGVQLDDEKLRRLGNDLDEKINGIEEEINKLAGYSLNVSSYKQLQTLLFEKRGLKGGKKGKNGFSTSSEELEKLKDQDAIIPLILEYRTYTKLRSTYTDSLIEMQNDCGRICTEFVQTGTATGRLSSKDPNLQNIPSHTQMGMKVREAFCAKEGCFFISSDYSQIELRVLAHISQDAELIKTIRAGVDIHRRTASIIFDVEENQVTNEMRAIAKAVNFGVIYGMSSYGLSQELHVSLKDATQFISSYFDTYKGVKDFIEKSYIECEKQGYVCTIMNRRRYVPEICSDKRQTVELGKRICVNTIIQGSAADIMKKAMIDVERELKAKKCHANIILQVHDELILEVPKEDVTKATVILKAKMEGAYELSVPLTVSISKGKNWAEIS